MKNILKRIVAAILAFEARLVLKKYKPKIIAITGSVGKTSTKDAVYTVLSRAFFVRKSEKSFNSDIGVPLTILGCHNAWSNIFLWLENIFKGLWLIVAPHDYPKWLVLEVGADRPGDIKQISAWLKPDIAIVTRFAEVPVHIEFFESREQLIQEKGYLVSALRDEGVFIVNIDDDDALSLQENTQARSVTFGFTASANVAGSHESILYQKGERLVPEGEGMRVHMGEETLPVHVYGGLGRQHLYPALAGIAAGVSAGMPFETCVAAIDEHATPLGRMHILQGIKETTIIDDTYNASPVATAEALRTLGELECPGRKIAVLGDMLELGRFSTEEHKKIGTMAAGVVGVLMTVGFRARDIAEGALLGGMSEEHILQFDDSEEVGAFLQNFVQPGDCILIKGSQSIRMEKAVAEIMAEPERREELLVRQDLEWQKR